MELFFGSDVEIEGTIDCRVCIEGVILYPQANIFDGLGFGCVYEFDIDDKYIEQELPSVICLLKVLKDTLRQSLYTYLCIDVSQKNKTVERVFSRLCAALDLKNLANHLYYNQCGIPLIIDTMKATIEASLSTTDFAIDLCPVERYPFKITIDSLATPVFSDIFSTYLTETYLSGKVYCRYTSAAGDTCYTLVDNSIPYIVRRVQ